MTITTAKTMYDRGPSYEVGDRKIVHPDPDRPDEEAGSQIGSDRVDFPVWIGYGDE
jgi:hypothetical protein